MVDEGKVRHCWTEGSLVSRVVGYDRQGLYLTTETVKRISERRTLYVYNTFLRSLFRKE